MEGLGHREQRRRDPRLPPSSFLPLQQAPAEQAEAGRAPAPLLAVSEALSRPGGDCSGPAACRLPAPSTSRLSGSSPRTLGRLQAPCSPAEAAWRPPASAAGRGGEGASLAATPAPRPGGPGPRPRPSPRLRRARGKRAGPGPPRQAAGAARAAPLPPSGAPREAPSPSPRTEAGA